MIVGSTGRLEKLQHRELCAHRKKVYSLGWNYDGRKLASGSVDQTIKIWTIEPHGQVSKAEKYDVELKGHGDSVNHLAWKPKENVLATTTAQDRSVRLWDTRQSKCAGQIGTSGTNMYLAWSLDGATVAVSNKENAVSFIDVRKHKILKTHKLPFEVNEIMYGPSATTFMATTGEGTVEVLSLPTFEPLWSLQAHSHQCACSAMSANHKYLVTGGGDALISVWDLDHMVCLRTLSRMDTPVLTLSINADQRYVAYAADDCLEVLDIKTGAPVHVHPLRATSDSVQFNPVYPAVLAFAAEEREDREGRAGYIGLLAPAGKVH